MPRETVRVGLVVLAALGALAVGIILIGEQNNLFRSKNHYVVRLVTAGGLQAGNPVQLNGVDVGRVRDVVLPIEAEKNKLEVSITVDARYAARIRADSRARIKTLGLLGDKFVDLTSGSEDQPLIEHGGEIPAAEATDVDRLLASGEDVVANIVSISVSLKEILARMERGEGLLGELMRPRAPGEAGISDTLQAMLDAVERASFSMEHGEGPLARMLHDRQLAEQVDAMLAKLDALLASLVEGDGLVPGLLHDAELRLRFERTLGNVEGASARLEAMAGALESGDGLLPRLLHDEALASQLTGELRMLLERLNRIAEQIDEGDGTVARLIDDPSVYQALNDIVIGIDESRLLRWLVRNRQKAGIEKRYEEATGGEEGAEEGGADAEGGGDDAGPGD